MNNKLLLVGFFALLPLLITAKSSLAQSSKLQQLKVAVSTATPHNTPLWVAKDKKLFDKYGVDVQLIFVMGGALVSQMLAAGEIQVAASSPAAFVSLIAGGEDIAAFLGISNTSPFALIAQPNIKKAADLRGKRIGTARFGGSSHVSALIALDHLGLDAKRDNIVIMQTGLDPERMAALEGKGLDAAMLQRLATKSMLSKGYTQLLNLNHAKIPYQNTVLAARRDYMAAIQNSLTISRGGSSKAMVTFSTKRTSRRSKRSSPRISGYPALTPPRIFTWRPRRNWIESLIRPSREPAP